MAPHKNCWDVMRCEYGPEAEEPCAVVFDENSNGYLGGENGGRACFYLVDTKCDPERKFDSMAEKFVLMCQECEFFHSVSQNEGLAANIFYYLRHIHERAVDTGNMNIIAETNKELFVSCRR